MASSRPHEIGHLVRDVDNDHGGVRFKMVFFNWYQGTYLTQSSCKKLQRRNCAVRGAIRRGRQRGILFAISSLLELPNAGFFAGFTEEPCQKSA